MKYKVTHKLYTNNELVIFTGIFLGLETSLDLNAGSGNSETYYHFINCITNTPEAINYNQLELMELQ